MAQEVNSRVFNIDANLARLEGGTNPRVIELQNNLSFTVINDRGNQSGRVAQIQVRAFKENEQWFVVFKEGNLPSNQFFVQNGDRFTIYDDDQITQGDIDNENEVLESRQKILNQHEENSREHLTYLQAIANSRSRIAWMKLNLNSYLIAVDVRNFAEEQPDNKN